MRIDAETLERLRIEKATRLLILLQAEEFGYSWKDRARQEWEEAKRAYAEARKLFRRQSNDKGAGNV